MLFPLFFALNFPAPMTKTQAEKAHPIYPPPPVVSGPSLGANVQRTMTLLGMSTPQKRNKVKVLFYGQSITQQNWTQDVGDDLKRRFPNADLTIENRAIGGFASSLLKRAIEHDLFSFYPDLVIFHDYGGEPDYETMIAAIRKRTTAEVILANDHLATGQQDDPKAAAWHDKHGFQWLPEIAKRYGCEYADVRGPWKTYLETNHLPVSALLVDGVHLNDQGCYLMAALIKPHLVYNPRAITPDGKPEAWKSWTRTYTVGKEVKWQGGKLTLPFEGNRVDVLANVRKRNAEGKGNVSIDDKRPFDFPELYAISRPSGTPHIGWPAVIRVDHEKPLVTEEWTAHLTDISEDGTKFKFSVAGSVTGPDGEGDSATRFVSKSGRVVLDPGDWFLHSDHEVSKKPMPATWDVRWKAEPQFVSKYALPDSLDPARDNATTLAQGLTNGPHTLTIISTNGTPLPIKAIRVYTPPVR